MPLTSCFTPYGQLRYSSTPSYVEVWYNLLPRLYGPALDMTIVGTYTEAKRYAIARMLALMVAELEHAGNQANPLKAYDLIPQLEQDYDEQPGARDGYVQRQQRLYADMKLPGGATAANVVNTLKVALGAGVLLSYQTNPNTGGRLPTSAPPTAYPSSPGTGGPGLFTDVRRPSKFLQLVDPVVNTGSAWCAYQALDTSAVPTTSWSPSTTYAVGQQIVPTAAGANGSYFECVAGGVSGTTEPTWPTGAGNTVADGSVTWTNVAPIATSLDIGDAVVVDAGSTKQGEAVKVTAVATVAPAGATPGYLYFQAVFANSHDVGAAMTTGEQPYWWSTQRLTYVVLSGSKAADPPTRSIVDSKMAKLSRAVTDWAVVQPSFTDGSGGTVGPLQTNSPMGCVSIGTVGFTNSV